MDNTFELTFDNWEGFAPAAHLNSLTEMGSMGSASLMTDCDVLSSVLTQGPGLTELSNMSSLNEMLNFVMDVPPENGITYGIGDTKIFSISPNALAQSTELSSEMITNGAFTGSETGWTFGDAGWTYNSNNVIHNGTVAFDQPLSQTISANVLGGTYKAVFNIGGTTGTVQVLLGQIQIDIYAAGIGEITADNFAITGAGDGDIQFWPSVDFDGTIDDVSVKRYSDFPRTITNCTQGESVIFMTTI